jgi:hypothetical protein
MKRLLLGTALIALSACSTETEAPDSDAKMDTSMVNIMSSDRASDRAAPNPTRNVYFGEMHVHTKNSFDAYIFNVRATLDDVYDFAKGKPLTHPGGFEMRLDGPPLDFAAATDHGAYLGILPALDDPDNALSKLEIAQGLFGTDSETILNAFQKIGASVRSGTPHDEIYDRDVIDNTWARVITTADKHYEPGVLTTFAGYEFTAVTTRAEFGDTFGGGNLHRNVFFKDTAPDRLFSVLDSPNPEDLWDWMDGQRAEGHDALAIPHNSNVSDGRMFAMDAYDGSALTPEAALQRLRNEPIVEMTQVKGTSETHPMLSPNDEFASFEIYESLLGVYQKSAIKGSYVREALANGLGIEAKTGVNPFKFGMIGASDSHVAGGAFAESDYWSKVGIVDATAEDRGAVPPGGAPSWGGVERDVNAEAWFSRWGASGLAAVWAEENTREAIFDAMRRRETYATSGPRIRLRVFGGTDFNAAMLSAADMTAQAYARGVPMGGELAGGVGETQLLIHAAKDPRGANLQRVQVIKVWHDGAAQERLWDVACSDGLLPIAGRCPDNGANVNLDTCDYSKDVGAGEIKTVWTDPEFDAAMNAAYYVRVLENPTCRWSTWQANQAGVERHPDRPATVQERAYSSPIWYSAK